jgi:hypothetical protein
VIKASHFVNVVFPSILLFQCYILFAIHSNEAQSTKGTVGQMLDTQTIFARYQSIRSRLPEATFDATTRDIQSLLDIREEVDAFVFDAFGVLNVGETPIPVAAARLDELRAS